MLIMCVFPFLNDREEFHGLTSNTSPLPVRVQRACAACKGVPCQSSRPCAGYVPGAVLPLHRPGCDLVVSIACLQSQRAGVTSLVAAMPVVIGEGLKPLTTSQTPSENSKSATGSADSAAKGACCPIRPNSTAK
jgi:hypothetical protein